MKMSAKNKESLPTQRKTKPEGDTIPLPRMNKEFYTLIENNEPFLALNNLDARWSQLKGIETNIFIIADLSFDIGVRFLKSANVWQKHLLQHNATLHYVAFADQTVSAEKLKDLSRISDGDQDMACEIQRSFPPNQTGTHRLWFNKHRIALTLIFGKINESIKSSDFHADCWFLDFANQDLKTHELCNTTIKAIARTFTDSTTYCSRDQNQSFVHQMQAIGFHSTTLPFKKHNSIFSFGHFHIESPKGTSTHPPKSYHRFPINRPWLNSSLPPKIRHLAKEQTIVIGAGMAGAWTARALAERGMKVIVVDKANEIASSASGNPVGVLYVKPGTEYTKATKMAMLSCTYANSRMMMLRESAKDLIYENCGVLQLLNTNADIIYANKLTKQNNFPTEVVRYATKEEASSLANTPLECPALVFLKCGRVFPKQLCSELLLHPNIEVILGFDADHLEKDRDKNIWRLKSKDQRTLQGEIVVVAAAKDTTKLEQTSHLPLKPIRGQVTIADIETKNNLSTVLCGDGYVAKTADNKLCFGASFILSETNTAISKAETLDNIKKLRNLSSTLHKETMKQSVAEMANRVSIRATTPDYLPIVGPVADNEQIKKDFFHLTKDSNYRFSTLGSYHDGLYVNVGHGSKGLTTSPIAAEIISDYIFNAPFSIDKNIIEALHPTRFTVRALIKNKIKKG